VSVEEAQRRLGEATDAVHALRGARRMAVTNGDVDWLADVRAAMPAALAEQRAASSALRELAGGGQR
jgi:hypothetical protein